MKEHEMTSFNINRSSLLLYFLIFAFTLQTIHAGIAEFDAYWQKRAAKANQNTLSAYTPDPTNVTNQINSEVSAILAGNDTRRSLKGGKKKNKGAPCEASNPIDKCWRCDPNWAKNRQRLADCSIGFARGTTGGKGGPTYVVTDNSDSDLVNPKPGTLRHAVIQKGPLWIIFAQSMIIELQQELIMTSHKTIDARGAIVKIANGPGLTLQYIKNVIIHGLRIHDIVPGSGGMIRDSVDHYGFRSDSDGDCISIYGCSNIWIDHVSLSRCHDGMIDCIMGSTAITISNCHFTDHNKVMLLGASNSYKQDQYMQVTVAFNHFGRGLVQRMPRCRWGFVHVVNNDYTHWLKYAIGGSQGPTIISQGNRFIAPDDNNAKEVTKREYAAENEWKNWVWTSEGDLMMNGAFFTQSGSALAAKKFSSQEFISFQPGTSVTRLARHSGSLDCFEGKAC